MNTKRKEERGKKEGFPVPLMGNESEEKEKKRGSILVAKADLQFCYVYEWGGWNAGAAFKGETSDSRFGADLSERNIFGSVCAKEKDLPHSEALVFKSSHTKI